MIFLSFSGIAVNGCSKEKWPGKFTVLLLVLDQVWFDGFQSMLLDIEVLHSTCSTD